MCLVLFLGEEQGERKGTFLNCVKGFTSSAEHGENCQEFHLFHSGVNKMKICFSTSLARNSGKLSSCWFSAVLGIVC